LVLSIAAPFSPTRTPEFVWCGASAIVGIRDVDMLHRRGKAITPGRRPVEAADERAVEMM
jgi:hypothetical protein